MWDEIRVAAEVARHGTLSSAAESLGIHRATVQRRVDSLEAYIGNKLFFRHSHGYTPTELGIEILQLSTATEAQLERLRLKSMDQAPEIVGEMIVTSIDGYAPFLLRSITEFSRIHPKAKITFVASNSNLKLELGQAHIAFRMGKRPEELDYVVIPHLPVRLGLYASNEYLDAYGTVDQANLADHKYVLQTAPEDNNLPLTWFLDMGFKPDIVLAADQTKVTEDAIRAGVGIGFFPIELAERNPSLVAVVPVDPKWSVPCWAVTHVDLHRSPKVQAFLKICRTGAKRGTSG